MSSDDPSENPEFDEIAERLRTERAVPSPAIRERASTRLSQAFLRRALQPRAVALLVSGSVALGVASVLALRPL